MIFNHNAIGPEDGARSPHPVPPVPGTVHPGMLTLSDEREHPDGSVTLQGK